MKEMQGLVTVLFLAICIGQVYPKKQVCVIGAGRAGLAAVKLLADQIDNYDVVGFERNSDVGGVWIYRDDPELDEHGLPAPTGIYKSLKTNLPKEMMLYSDYTDFKGYDFDYFPHEVFLQYLRNYTDNFQLRKYIKFDTMVTKVFPVKGDGDWKTTTWHMETRNLNTNEESAISCDAVMVCNGRYSKPHRPRIRGLKSFRGKILHSRSYRKPEDFTGQTVVVLGAGNSASDITRELTNYTKKIYHSQKLVRNPITVSSKLQLVPRVKAAKHGQLILKDKTAITADSFIMCTGYEFDYPFLDERSGIIFDKNDVNPLYEDFINVEHPSMALIGLTFSINYGRLYYQQTNQFLDALSGKTELPSYEEMLAKSKQHCDLFK